MTHISGLDGVRGLAVALVVAFHVSGVFYNNSVTWLFGSFLGVDIFFVLSGFLITWMLHNDQVRSEKLRVKRFFGRRIRRLVPAMVFFLFFQFLYVIASGQSRRLELWSVGLAATSLLNYSWYFDHVLSVLNPTFANLAIDHLWSISVEVHFYLLAPLMVGTIASIRRSRWLSIGSVVALIVAVAAWRYYIYENGTSILYSYTRTDTRIDSFLVGLLLALVWQHFSLPREVTRIAGWAGLAFLAYAVTMRGGGYAFLNKGGYTIAALAAACVMSAVLTDVGPARLFRIRPLRLLGRVSYGLYLWHFLVFFAVARWCHDWSRPIQITLALAISALATSFSWRFVERPLLARRAT